MNAHPAGAPAPLRPAAATATATSPLSSRPRSTAQALGRAAVVALYEEIALYPKPGLVSFVDSGSHVDMDARTFLRSLFTLRHAFVQMAALGAAGAPFAALERLGIEAERRMLVATGGINTHRGAIFTLGLLCAAGGHLSRRGERLTPQAVRDTLMSTWGQDLSGRCRRPARAGRAPVGAGVDPAGLAGLRSAGEEAALGMPVLFETAWPALRSALAAGLTPQQARVHTLLAIIAVLDDTNLVHRGGLAGLRWAQAEARALLARGGLARPEGLAATITLHQAFVARRLSPGGAADVLAAACWLQRLDRPD